MMAAVTVPTAAFAALLLGTAVAASAEVVFNIVDYGAVGDNATLCTRAIQAAVGAAVAAGGGTVLVPATASVARRALYGRDFTAVYRTGTISLAANVTLQIDAGAALQGTANASDYSADWDYWHVVQGVNVSNVAVVGGGAIVGAMWQMVAGYNEAQQQWIPQPWDADGCVGECRPKNLAFIDATNVVVSGIALLDSSDWTSLFRRCHGVVVSGLFIRNSRAWPNGDGMDLESGTDIVIENCDIATGDDAIAMRSGNCNTMRTPWPEPWGHISPLTRVTVTNCTLSSTSAAVKIEALFQLDHGNVTEVTVRDSHIVASNRGVGIWQRIGSGIIANITVTNTTIEVRRLRVVGTAHPQRLLPSSPLRPNLQAGFVQGSTWWGSGEALVVTSVPENANQSRYGLRGIHNVTFADVTATANNGALFSARDQQATDVMAITGLALVNVTLTITANGTAIVWPQHDFRPMDAGAATPNIIPHAVDAMFFEGVASASLSDVSVVFAAGGGGGIPAYWDGGGSGPEGVVCVSVTAGSAVSGLADVGCALVL